MVSVKKKLQVEKLSQILTESQNFALVKFGSISHNALENLRRELKKNATQLKIIKKSLFEKSVNKLSLKESKLKELQKKVFPLRENSALLTLGENYFEGLNTFARFAKNETTLSFKFGFLDNKLYLKDDLNKLALLPSKEEILARITRSLKSPSTKLTFALKFPIYKISYILKSKIQGGE